MTRPVRLLAALTLLAVGTAASAQWAMDPTGRQKYAPPKDFKESPLLAARVAAGDLPPIEDRIPAEPFVVGPGVLNSEQWLDWEPGNHGGTIRVPNLNNSGVHEIYLALGMSILRAPDQSTKDPLPAVVSEYDISDDFREFCFTIREGLRWSDGELVTTEDVRMTFELYGDERIYPTFYFRAADPDGNPPTVTIIDDLSFCVEFDVPYGFFLANLASWIPDYTLLFRPAHFIKQFHADYTPMDQIQPLLDELELDTWEQLVQQKDMAALGASPRARAGRTVAGALGRRRGHQHRLPAGAQPLLLEGGRGRQPAPLRRLHRRRKLHRPGGDQAQHRRRRV